MEKKKASVSIITPVLNPSTKEVRNYFLCLERLNAIMGPTHDLCFLVINDGSNTKETIQELLKSNKVKVISHEKNQGKGKAIKLGIEHSQNTDYILYTDFDFPYMLEDLCKMIDQITLDKVDIILAKRGISYFQSLPLQRKLISKSLILFNKWILGLKHFDTQGGLKSLKSQHSGIILDTRNEGYLFEIEFIRAAEKANLTILDQEVTLRNNIEIPSVSYKIIRQNIEALMAILFRRH